MPNATCAIPDCSRSVVARGWCSMHWQRWNKHGDPLIVLPPKGPPPVDPWTRIDTSGGPDACWPWTHRVDDQGYGIFKAEGKQWRAARWMLTQKLGREMPDDEVTRHTCDNPICCNPAHLIPGMPVDNTRDMITRGRHIHGDKHWTRKHPERLRGEANPAAVLDAERVLEIRRRYAAGELQVPLAAEYGVKQVTISAIVRRKTWTNLEDECLSL